MSRRHWKRWVITGAALLVALAVGGPFVFIHFVEGSPAAKLALPAASGQVATGAGTSAAHHSAGSTSRAQPRTSTLGGTWRVSSGSRAGYRVEEVLVGQSTTAVGRTSKVTGQVKVTGNTVTAASFTVQMGSVVSDESQRNAHFDGPIMDVATYPTATFHLTKRIALGAGFSTGRKIEVTGTGKLTLHGVTREITIDLSAERLPAGVDVLGDTNIVFSDWQIANPSIAGFVTTADHGTLEVLLHLTRSRSE